MILQPYTGLMKIYTNHSIVLAGSTAVVEHKDKNQAAMLETAVVTRLTRYI
jgi:uncharacterized cupin superfamily protein